MKQLITKNIIIEMTREEVELLMSALNSASIRRREQGIPEYAEVFFQLWKNLYDITEELPF